MFSTIIAAAWYDHLAIRWTLMGAYLLLLGSIGLYGLHRYWLVSLYWRHRRTIPQPPAKFAPLPSVTVQLPMFNEPNVAERVIDAACRLDYPRDQLQIQVLDDSTDCCHQIARRRCAFWQAQGVDIQYLHREDRHGFKAGALQDAMATATGRFIAIFDADFVPPAQFIRRTIDYFTARSVGMVQARWGHLNRTDSLLTRLQGLFLDGHFVIEHTARNRSHRWMNFNGTAGIWRRESIEDAGGWQHDTLTEDVDLSYRCQLAGWRFVYLPDLTCPAELPPEMNAFKAQQYRWTKGSIQTAIKLLPNLLRAPVPVWVKTEAFFHLTCPMVYVFVTLMALLFFPTLYVNIRPFDWGTLFAVLLTLASFIAGTVSIGVFCMASQSAIGRSRLTTLFQIPMLMSLGIGVAINNARGCLEALVGYDSPFVRTPKYNATLGVAPEVNPKGAVSGQSFDARRLLLAKFARRRTKRWSQLQPPPSVPVRSVKLWMPIMEFVMGLYTLNCVRVALQMEGALVSIPFLLLFAWGYFYVGFNSMWPGWQVRRHENENSVSRAEIRVSKMRSFS